MKTPFLSLTTGGIFAILLGLIFWGIGSYHSGKNDEFLERGLLREGRVVSHQKNDDAPESILRLMTNVSHKVTGADMQIIELEVTDSDFEKAPVGTLIKLILVPGNPPRARLAASAKRNNYRFGYVLASLCICLGALMLWLEWKHHQPIPPQTAQKSPNPKDPSNTQKALPRASLSDIMEKQTIKDPLLYDGPFAFSYSAEKTSVELKDGTTIRISQYLPISELPKVLADKDLLHVLRTAESDWKLVDTIKSGDLALSFLLKEKHANEETDQFFINGPYLGLLYREEIDTGQWYSFVRGIWKITPLSHTIAHITSGDPDLAREAAFEILNHPDLTLIASLAPGTSHIRAALKDTPRTGEFADDRRFITRAADVIDSLASGNCYCRVYAKTSDSPDILVKKEKFSPNTPSILDIGKSKKEDKRTELTCNHCQKKYQLTEHIGSYVPYYVWEELKASPPPNNPTTQ